MIRSAALKPFSGCAVTAVTALCLLAWQGGTRGQASYTVLHTFAGYPNDGGQPSRGLGLIQGPDGTMYGTTFNGGSASFGTVFQIAPDGSSYTVLHSFTNTSDGSGPPGLLQTADGTLYGTSAGGGSSLGGTIFQMAPDGSEFAPLYSFGGGPTDGQNPHASLIEGSDGALYGTTYGGGSAGRGTVFKIAPDGTGFTLLHSFTGGPTDGEFPRSSLIQAPGGTLYGTTPYGGSMNYGTVFQIGSDGTGYTLLRDLTPIDGGVPLASLIQGPDGTLYGTTAYGGSANAGTAFQMAPDGSGFAVLHNFNVSDGVSPNANVIRGPDGTLYGTTSDRGPAGGGTIFQMASDGSGFALLHSFGGPDGYNPRAGLLQRADGTLYGTTSDESSLRHGVIFSLSPGAGASRTTTASYTSRRGKSLYFRATPCQVHSGEMADLFIPETWATFSGRRGCRSARVGMSRHQNPKS
jgi:uncharacterized repeat protein (TIGR03803 family)